MDGPYTSYAPYSGVQLVESTFDIFFTITCLNVLLKVALSLYLGRIETRICRLQSYINFIMKVKIKSSIVRTIFRQVQKFSTVMTVFV